MTITANPSVREVLAQVVRDPRYAAVARKPVLSWPHLGLTALAWGTFVVATWAYLAGNLHWSAMLLLNQFALYIAFTPLHDAVHNAASGSRRVNDAVGTVSGYLLFPGITTPIYRTLHMEHHRWVGDRDRDPDHWFVHAPKPLLPFVFAGLEWIWVHWYITKLWATRCNRERTLFVALIVVYLGIPVALLSSPYAWEYFLCWMLPHWMAAVVLVYVFAHIQHPDESTWEVAPFQSTVEVRGTTLGKVYWLGQTDHCMHHAMPHISFHRYHHLWELADGAFRKAGIPERGLFRGPAPFEIPRRAYDTTVAARVIEAREVGAGIRTYLLAGVEGDLPGFTPGAHVDLHLPSGRVRQYSLCGPAGPGDQHRYRIAVKALPGGRGGSMEAHASLRVGEFVTLSAPRNNFGLLPAQRYVLVGGGIGLTPLLSMAHHLHAAHAEFTLNVCASGGASVPFGAELDTMPFAPELRIHAGGRAGFDPAAAVGEWSADSRLYLCGPAGFMDGVAGAAAAAGWPADAVHRESFTAAVIDVTHSRPFDVVLGRSGRRLRIPAERQILDVLAEHDIEVPWSCSQGVCGTCVTPVLEGEVEHRDAVLDPAVRASNAAMCLCVSRAKGERVVLDL